MMRRIVLALALLASGTFAEAAEPTVQFNQDIQPILSDNCFACHGTAQNKRKGKLRLDVREEAIARKTIVPGKPAESELIVRILTSNPDERMPPADTHKVLSSEQKELLREWIAAGAEYEGHWPYIPPAKVGTPVGKNAIDYLVTSKGSLRWITGCGNQFSLRQLS